MNRRPQQDQARLWRAPGNEGVGSRVPELPVGEVLVGDALEQLRRLPEGSVDCVVTSPPYFLLRNYAVDGQLGAEGSVSEWVEHLRAVLAEVARVLKPEGTLWLNLGDTYARQPSHGAPAKSLVLGPERLLLRLTEDGWTLRNKLVWAKPNPTPASVRDRFTCTWEPIYLLTRNRHYYFDLDAIREPAKAARPVRPAKTNDDTSRTAPGQRPVWSGPLAGTNSGLTRLKAGGRSSHVLGKNPGDVWTIPTAAYRGAHFATYPPQLLQRPLLAGCPEQVCTFCGTAWRRAAIAQRVGALAVRGVLRKACGCSSRAWQPGIVLDPFMGAGTTAVAAEALGRRWVGIELNPDYAHLAEQRIQAARQRRARTRGRTA